MKYKLKVYSILEFGQRKDSNGRPHQEDSIFPEFGNQNDADRLFILCDGMGGHDAGEVASATVCAAMSSAILGNDSLSSVFTAADFNSALATAYDALDKKDSGAEKKMGTTMTFLKLSDDGALIAHMGDSRVYHIRPGKNGEETQILFETSDHSLVNDLIKVKELTREEARHSKQKNVITRAMQPNMDRRAKADIYTTKDIRPGDYFYMCSDGMLEQDEMEDGTALRNIFSEMGGDDESKVAILTSATARNRDNHSAFIIHILDVEDQEPVVETNAVELSEENNIDDRFNAIVEEASEDSVVVTLDKETVAKESVVTSQEEETTGKPTTLEEKTATKHISEESTQTDSSKGQQPLVGPNTNANNKKSQKPFKFVKDAVVQQSNAIHIRLSFRWIAIVLATIVVLVCLWFVRSCSSDNKPEKSNPNKVEQTVKRSVGRKRANAEPKSTSPDVEKTVAPAIPAEPVVEVAKPSAKPSVISDVANKVISTTENKKPSTEAQIEESTNSEEIKGKTE